jgi:hypothetical protein
MSCFMLILTWGGIIFVYILELAFARYKISTIIMPPHVKMSIKHDIRELFLNFQLRLCRNKFDKISIVHNKYQTFVHKVIIYMT